MGWKVETNKKIQFSTFLNFFDSFLYEIQLLSLSLIWQNRNLPYLPQYALHSSFFNLILENWPVPWKVKVSCQLLLKPNCQLNIYNYDSMLIISSFDNFGIKQRL